MFLRVPDKVAPHKGYPRQRILKDELVGRLLHATWVVSSHMARVCRFGGGTGPDSGHVLKLEVNKRSPGK